MEIQQLKGFYHVAKLGSFTRAAQATFRTQSALSQQVKALEEELGCRLLHRIGRKKLRMTQAGERLFRFAESLFIEVESLREELSDLRGFKRGRLKIAAPFTTLYHLFPGILKSYMAEFPLAELTVLDRDQRSVIGLVRDGDVDLGVALESLVPNDMNALRFREVQTVLMAPEGHPLNRVREVTIDRIAQYPLILPPKDRTHAGRTRLEELLSESGLTYRVIMESSNVELSSLYVEMGLGISFATVVKDLIGLKNRRLRFIYLNHLFEPEYLSIVMRKDRVLTPLKRAFLDTLFGHSGNYAEPGGGPVKP